MTIADHTFWQPIAGVDQAQRRSERLNRARDFFAERNVLEVDTPCLAQSAVSDPNIENVSASLSLAPGQSFYLQTSPEFYMKRLLAAGFPDIFSIGKVFRDAEVGRLHQPEFTMIEWYRLGFGLDKMINETIDLIQTLIRQSRIDAEADRMSYCEAFQRFAGIDPMTADVGELIEQLGADRDLQSSMGGSVDGWLDLMLATQVSNHFPTDRLTVIDHYPSSQAALARVCPDNPKVADRFEVFFGSLELANGYVELTDAAEQRRRCEMDQKIRSDRHARLRPIDEKFIAALDSGLPECAGVAVGFDRLLMVDAKFDNLSDTRHFPIEA